MIDIPLSLLQSLEKREEFSKDSFLKAHEDAPIVSIRLNPAKEEASLNISERSVPWNPHGYYLQERPAFVFDPLFHAGCYYVQEASSMFIWEILRQINISSSPRVLDLCAAPGGKTTLLASYFPDGLIVANEVIKSRASILAENASKWGTGNIVVTNNDPKQIGQLPGFFDVILVDAPCSGSGLFRKETSWREEWSEENVDLCSQRQKRILADVYNSLKEDGILIYSTCSFSQEEDEDIVDWLMDSFKLENIALSLPSKWGISETHSPKHGAYAYRFYPDKLKGEGFFVAVFRKKESSGYPIAKDTDIVTPTKLEEALVKKWLKHPDRFFLYKIGDSFHAIDKQFEQDLNILKSRLYLKKGGVEVGMIKGKDLVPSIELGLSIIGSDSVPLYNLEKEDALQFLRKNDISLKDDMPKGWVKAAYLNHPLGWMKVLPNRINNYYPMEWRIRKQ